MAWGRKRKDSKAAERARKASVSDVEARAMMLLAMRDHGTEELRKKLRDKHFPHEHIDTVIERFESYNYLDDERIARRTAESLARQKWGPSQIKLKLRNRSYTSAQIKIAIDEAVPEEEQWIAYARDRLRSKFRKEPHELDQDERQKAWRHLAYRGYSGRTISGSFYEEEEDEDAFPFA